MPTLPTPNMNLNLPVVGQELGPQYGQDNNAAFFQVDSHNHTAGQGVQIPPSGLDINTDLPFNGNNATSMNAVEFNSNSMPLPGASPYLNSIYFANGNFYVNDGVGNQIQITNNGTVNATSSGIVSGTASASFVGGVLVVDQAANTPGNIQAGSILIGNNVANSFFSQLNAPSALSATYNWTAPPTNSTGNTVFLTYDSSNNIGLGPTVSAGLTQSNFSAAVNALLNNANIPGNITMYGGPSAPTGWLLCDGTAYDRTIYANLFAIIGTNYGIGDGSTTFNVPDFRGIFPRGVDNGAGNDPDSSSRVAVNGGNSGDNVGSLQPDATNISGINAIGISDPTHAHIQRINSVSSGGSTNFAGGGDSAGPVTGNPSTTGASATGVTIIGGGTGTETRPINLYVNFIIKT